MAEIELSKGKVAIVDEADVELLSAHSWHAVSKDGVHWYAEACRRNIAPKTIGMHRLLMNATKGMVVDHINGDGLDNRRSNLRLCTQGKNRLNSRKSTAKSSRFKGVVWHKRDARWQAQAQLEHTHYHIGQFKSEIAAALAYDAFARTHFGEFAHLNFPEDH